jgi:hypothetical protein
MDPYTEALTTIREVLQMVVKQKTECTPLSELRHIETLVNLLEFKVQGFYTILPKMDRRRALLDIEGYVLKTVFDVATTNEQICCTKL